MSVVVAIKENGKVYMGADTQSTRGSQRIVSSSPNNYKMAKVKNSEHCLIGLAGNVIDNTIIKLAEEIIPKDYDGEVDFEFVNNHVVPYIFEVLGKRDRILKDKDDDTPYIDCSMLFACKDKLFHITGSGTVMEHNDCFVIGGGDDVAFGSLMSTEGQPAIDRLLKALSVTARYNIYVGAPFIVADTDTCDIQVIEEKDW